MTDADIRDMVRGGEGPTVEFKAVVPDVRAFARLLASFANAEGGTVLIGVADDSRIVGTDTNSLAAKVSEVLKLLRPEPRTSVTTVVVDGASVGVVKVEASSGPVFAEGAAFRRLGSSTHPMTPEDLRRRLGEAPSEPTIERLLTAIADQTGVLSSLLGDHTATAPLRPAVFVGSSSEGLKVAHAVQVALDRSCEVEVWSQGVFGLSHGTLESLVLALERFDFAVLVLTADDLTTARGSTKPTARDNVVFELGLFVGGLGRDRTFMLYDRTVPPSLPSDLAGVTAATFAPHSSGNLEAAVGAPCTVIQRAIERAGVREGKRARQLDEAAASVSGVKVSMQRLLRLLAHSRKVELDIIASQFGPLINSEKLTEINRDLQDLEAILKERDGA
ncbi:MAG: nucleotide-binding protein [Deltaproteobacteria bacterium]|nr:nucleotide-binding protein [Deltaproteobacteria bacterium]